jgi:hypothetical protein
MYDTILSRDTYALIYLGIWLFGPPWGPEGGENIVKPSYFNLPPDIGLTSGPQSGLIYMYDTSKRLSMPLLNNYSP